MKVNAKSTSTETKQTNTNSKSTQKMWSKKKIIKLQRTRLKSNRKKQSKKLCALCCYYLCALFMAIDFLVAMAIFIICFSFVWFSAPNSKTKNFFYLSLCSHTSHIFDCGMSTITKEWFRLGKNKICLFFNFIETRKANNFVFSPKNLKIYNKIELFSLMEMKIYKVKQKSGDGC